VENLKVRRRRLHRSQTLPACKGFYSSDGQPQLHGSGDHSEVDVVIDGLLVIEVNLLALSAGVLP